jgi:hypothetical protein
MMDMYTYIRIILVYTCQHMEYNLCICKCVCEVDVTLHACIWTIQVMHSCQHMNYNTHIHTNVYIMNVY